MEGHPMEWVVKIGGSLFPEYSISLAEKLVGRKVLVLCGGGEMANKIREFNESTDFSPFANHQAAILCMDILGILLADKIDCAKAVKSLRNAKKVLEDDELPILLPSTILNYLDPLEHSWRVTSDSISLYISHLVKAKLLIATDVDGIYTPSPSQDGAQFIKEINAKKLLNFGETSLDESFAELLLQYKSNSYVVNGQYPERVMSILDGKSSTCTFIGGD
jgi:5-(aminomethyl)-3-furanmethanol phosphate kinase